MNCFHPVNPSWDVINSWNHLIRIGKHTNNKSKWKKMIDHPGDFKFLFRFLWFFGTEVRIISQKYSEATQLMPTITWAKKSSSKSTYIGTIKKLKMSPCSHNMYLWSYIGRFGWTSFWSK